VKANPAWIERALRNPAEHKRTVDVYRFETESSTTTLGPRVYLNGVPVAQNDQATVDFNSSGTPIDVLANDSDPDNDTLTITAVGAAAHGVATISGGVVSYVPAADYSGADSFTYTISDGNGGTATATVNVTVNTAAESNQLPVAVNDDGGVLKGYQADINVLGNDSDPDGDPLTVVAVEHTGPGSCGTFHQSGWNGALHVHPRFLPASTPSSTRFPMGRGGTAKATVSVIVWELLP
jgi:hypothetical protein